MFRFDHIVPIILAAEMNEYLWLHKRITLIEALIVSGGKTC